MLSILLSLPLSLDVYLQTSNMHIPLKENLDASCRLTSISTTGVVDLPFDSCRHPQHSLQLTTSYESASKSINEY